MMPYRPTWVAAAAVILMVVPGIAQDQPGRASAPPVYKQVQDFKPVTDAMLRNPDPANWINWRRTYDAWGYSPLNQITKQNVNQLQLAWSWEMEPGVQQPTPLVYDGVMYLANPGTVVQAMDAATGDLLWEYRRQYKTPRRLGDHDMMRNLEIYDDKIYVNTADAHIVALDAKTGKVAWDAEVADPNKGYYFTSGGLIAEGVVIVGTAGCGPYNGEGCFIAGHDAMTGKQLWRVNTIAQPGQPGGDTWGGLPAMFRAGGEAWGTGSYDPDLHLVFWGTAQAKPHAQVSRGTDGAALFTTSELAIEPKTGKLVWYYQFIPGESQDMDEVFEPVLFTEPGGRKVLMEMGKLGILWRLDARTGKYISASDVGYQNIFDLDQKTGRVSWRPGKLPQLKTKMDMCPGHAGFRDWRASAYHPQTRALYIPMNLNCMTAYYNEVQRVVDPKTGGPQRAGGAMSERREYILPAANGNLGEFLAMEADTGKILWRHRNRSNFNTAALTTGGNLAFVGDWDRHMYAFDVTNGDLLWQTRLSHSTNGSPVTYSVRGRQYLAVPVGGGGAPWGTSIPAQITPEIHRPGGRTGLWGNALYVFALPETKAGN